MKKIYSLCAGVILAIAGYSQCAVTIGSVVTPQCNGDCTGSATATPSGFIPNTVSYSWAPSGGTAATASNLCAGTYTVTATNGVCTATQTVTIAEPAVLVATETNVDVACFGGSNGSATAMATGGTPNYSYSWNTAPVQNTQTATGLTPGSYTCTVTDQNGCTATAVAVITEPSSAVSATSSVTDVSCLNGSDGTATAMPAGGTPPYSYSWNTVPAQTTQTATGLMAGVYSCSVTDANGCATSVGVTITQPSTAVSVTTTANMTSCNGACDGMAMASASGGTPGYIYVWSTGDSATSISGLCAGAYVVTVMDTMGCTVMDTVMVNQPAVLMANVTVMNATCFGFCDAICMSNPTGGTAPFIYSWTSGATTQNDSGLCIGTQGVLVTDANGCTSNQIVTVTQPAAIAATATGTDATCIGCQNGSATVTATGGNGVYSYLWTPGNQTTATASGLGLGTYIVCVTDSNSCPSGCDTVMINDGTGINGYTSPYNVNVFPNPVDNQLNISIESAIPVNVQVTLFDISGRAVIAQNFGSVMSENKSLDLSNQSSGVYFLEVNVDGQKTTTKLIRN